MSQSEKSVYYQALKTAGVTFDHHYREYSTEDLRKAYEGLGDDAPPLVFEEPTPQSEPPAPPPYDPPVQQAPVIPPFDMATLADQAEAAAHPAPVRQPRDPNEFAGQRLNQKADDEIIRIDDEGRAWLQEEILKPAFPKPRARRVLTYLETGVKEQTVKSGEYTETFEVSGDQPARPAEVKITLPSYQVGIYRDPRFPFKIHTYNGQAAFDLFEVQEYYGGPELVPDEVKRVYIENVLAYDMRTTVRAIQAEYRQLQLAGKVD
jgi:hypothetical protein